MNFTQTNIQNFNSCALSTFVFQYENNATYRAFCQALGKNPDSVSSWKEIPFLPISFFKTHNICLNKPVVHTFESSGTGGERSRHLVNDMELYAQSFFPTFQNYLEQPIEETSILALLPSYLERTTSSLVFMVNALLPHAHSSSGFFLNNFQELKNQIDRNENEQRKTLLIGVSFALLDFSEQFPMEMKYTTVMETGGMKGRRQEMTRNELHASLKKSFGISAIHSEYGMTELFSQAYSKGNGVFSSPFWMRVVCRDIQDPLSLLPFEKRGALNIIDLANQNSCAFIATEDIGLVHEDLTFEVEGRMNQAEIRGCNLLFSES